MRPGLQKYGMAILIGVVVFVLLVVTARNIGLTWDEPAYIAAARSYVNWHEFVKMCIRDRPMVPAPIINTFLIVM